MSGFSAEWLALREPVDVAARALDVTRAALAAIARKPSVCIVDLGGGTGSNIRYLRAHVAVPARWSLADHDPALLAVARARLGATVETTTTDLRVLEPSLFDGADLVTASALLDLVSESWMLEFVRHCRRVGAAVLVALNYDGRMSCDPADGDDEFVRALVNRHQRTDKGFGPALGPEAASRAEALLRHAGYEVVSASSDWHIAPEHAELQRQLIRGWADASAEISPTDTPRIRAWEQRRLSLVDRARSHIVVGHRDVAGGLPE
ncbi:MAG: class I SAM-dependent methyltransferase [Acidobacteria bacterium]|nr:class I SAM-dependent methyltransferase [Acidobacteriota bacterium]